MLVRSLINRGRTRAVASCMTMAARRRIHTSLVARGGGENLYVRGQREPRPVPGPGEDFVAVNEEESAKFRDGSWEYPMWDYVVQYERDPGYYWRDLARLTLFCGGLLTIFHYKQGRRATGVTQMPVEAQVYGNLLLMEDLTHLEELKIRQWDHDTQLVGQLVEDFNADPSIPYLDRN